MDLDRLLDIEGVHGCRSVASDTLKPLARLLRLPKLDKLAAMLMLDLFLVLANLLRVLLILFHLLLGVPEPLVDLLLGQPELLREVLDLVWVRLVAAEALEELPQLLLLLLIFALAAGSLILADFWHQRLSSRLHNELLLAACVGFQRGD